MLRSAVAVAIAEDDVVNPDRRLRWRQWHGEMMSLAGDLWNWKWLCRKSRGEPVGLRKRGLGT